MERAFADLGNFINPKRSGPINVIEFICNGIDVAVDYYPPPDLKAPALYAYLSLRRLRCRSSITPAII
jgi:hypothetical protein